MNRRMSKWHQTAGYDLTKLKAKPLLNICNGPETPSSSPHTCPAQNHNRTSQPACSSELNDISWFKRYSC